MPTMVAVVLLAVLGVHMPVRIASAGEAISEDLAYLVSLIQSFCWLGCAHLQLLVSISQIKQLLVSVGSLQY